jgi:hypothetical protein
LPKTGIQGLLRKFKAFYGVFTENSRFCVFGVPADFGAIFTYLGPFGTMMHAFHVYYLGWTGSIGG